MKFHLPRQRFRATNKADGRPSRPAKQIRYLCPSGIPILCIGREEGGIMADKDQPMPSAGKEEEVIKKKYGGLVPKKAPLISKDHERAYFDSADWALGKQGAEKPKGPLEALRPKLEPTHQQTRYRKSPCAPENAEDANKFISGDAAAND
ncbi:uncharacterized protein [Rutidosis leptorrhynchoides]|uniref:uncharacterized protein n=1 Tax=Rutidosis leptorrhynchoides TaxID=125765 RepID=UPI003A99A7B3